MARKVTKEALIELGIEPAKAAKVAAGLNEVKPRTFKYVAFMTEEQCQAAAEASGVEFERASLKYRKISKTK